jgi:hypothetical protein
MLINALWPSGDTHLLLEIGEPELDLVRVFALMR